ncbi:Ethanolamine utilization protein EutN/carboxysome structural protein Ccml [Desulforamulus reducens MI-1]|uniref:Ethanolamine utilization protein EutN/carboxysome structural protein Ccml n=1 Tax=Desulforamulus reducens (strain ATCC BAA-1160 / DSM 100696 / MI-1) TaxID=349161 RepID=A4J432_DESRM|nr:EutN/CcmL family microcompartment protein [Desulforamulus reducens]ABO49835.1 Ethanolamine utilization protein EutN/carboxysome structural protein Ccml [Desulforamulus reducens MI-1]
MILGKVVSSVWATRKETSLTGVKFMIVEILETLSDLEDSDKIDRRKKRKVVVAADLVGAGIGEKVLVSRGSSARQIEGLQETPVDMAIIGIIDEER